FKRNGKAMLVPFALAEMVVALTRLGGLKGPLVIEELSLREVQLDAPCQLTAQLQQIPEGISLQVESQGKPRATATVKRAATAHAAPPALADVVTLLTAEEIYERLAHRGM